MKEQRKEITVSAYAKINLSLDVTGKREDGYHEVSMILQAVDLHDDVTCARTPGEEDRISLRVIQDRDDEKREKIPEDERNIAYRAAVIMQEMFPDAHGSTEIIIKKRIPAAAGLAGGSSNGAAVVLAMYRLMSSEDPARAGSVSTEDLLEAGGRLGADVPFQMMVQMKMNGVLGMTDDPAACTCALAEGTGTDLEPVTPLKSYIVLVTPDIGVSTKEVYEGIDGISGYERPDNAELAEALENGNVFIIRKNMLNVLEKYTLNVYDTVYNLKNRLSGLCREDETALMSGSGPTVFAATCSERHAGEIFEEMSGGSDACFLTKTL